MKDPVKFSQIIMDDIISNGEQKTRFLMRLVPIEATCKSPQTQDIAKLISKVPLVCTNILPFPEWRTKLEGCSPECSKLRPTEHFHETIHNKEEGELRNDEDSNTILTHKKECLVSKYHEFVASKCVPKQCIRPSFPHATTIVASSLGEYQLTVGSIVSIICHKGYVLHRSSSGRIPAKRTKLVCRFDEVDGNLKFSSLDGLFNTSCTPG